MAIDFKVKDVMHNIIAKFVHAFLPEAKKPYNLRAVHQEELDIHGIASKASVYNLQTSPKVIEEGMNAGMELIYYLVADGFRIKTPLFNLRMRLPGEYNGSETHLNPDAFPVARMQATAGFRNYLKDKVKIKIDGIDQTDGYIAEVTDEATGIVDEVLTLGNLITIRGWGLKIDGAQESHETIGLYFESDGEIRTKAEIIAVNEPRTIKAIVPYIPSDTKYRVVIVTQTSAKNSGALLKSIRELRADTVFTVQN
ncbi:MAG: DUF4469 domain-containing protein [Spirochaetes bacterium]|nr:DUF4469 domain-containing protein [Spirochaetota bacterium]